VHLLECGATTISFCFDGYKRHDKIPFSEDLMNLYGEDTATQSQGVIEKSNDLVVALVIAR